MTLVLRYGAPLVLLTLMSGCATTEPTTSQVLPATQPSIGGGASTEEVRTATPATQEQLNAKPTPAEMIPDDRSVYYDFDKTDVKPQGERVIEASAKYLRDHPDLKVRVEGNADERGSREYNLALGQRRADGVASRMELLGVPEKRIEAVSFGEEKPKMLGHDETSWAENRRSDIAY